MALKSENITMNIKKIRRIMKKYNLICKIRGKNKSRITLQKNIENMNVSNVLNRNFKQNVPYTFASTDITYLKYKNIFSFLSVIKDLASGEILAWKLSKQMNLDLVTNTLSNLKKYSIKNNVNLSKMVLHSDQGFQYTSIKYHKKLLDLKITQSMSRKGNAVDNAPIESFFGHLKDEIECKNLNFDQLHNLIKNYIINYNYKRKQWNKEKMTPVEYRNYLNLNSLQIKCSL